MNMFSYCHEQLQYGDIMKPIFLILLSATFLSQVTLAQEPAYCDPKTFLSKEVDPHEKIWRDRAFRLGDVLLIGGALGYSRSKKVVEFVEDYSNADSSDKYCTWYLNQRNDHAADKFNYFPLPHPKNLTVETGPQEFGSILKDQFSKSKTSFLSCIEKHKFLLMGCDGQMHRGPSVFGMMLSFSGCSAANSAKIVNGLWGLNGVKPEVRLAIIEEGRKFGDQDPQARRRMQKAFGY
jgi:hypothetical protein